MNEIEIKLRIIDIQKELFSLLLKPYKRKRYEVLTEIRYLYREYLQLIVKLQKSNPSYNNGKCIPYKNCYFYALDLPLPKIFKLAYEKVSSEKINTDLGMISYPEDVYRIYTPNTSEQTLDYLASDLDALNIKSYASTINLPPQHNGYKIAIFSSKSGKDYDYHFIRQNQDGSWSSKIGYEDCVVKMNNPNDYLNDNIFNFPTNYEYLKTIEIVKPKLK